MKKIVLLIVIFASIMIYSADINVNGYTLYQYTSAQSVVLPDTVIPEGYYLVVGRNATEAEFEAFWGALPANAIYFNSVNNCPMINGDETYSLDDSGGTQIDSTTSPLSGGNTAQRDATNVNTWTQSADTNAAPGSGVTGGNGVGLVITEYSDASGTGNYIYEFVEIYNDGGSASNSPPSIGSLSHSPDPVMIDDNVAVTAGITDDSGIAADTLFYSLNSGAWNSVMNDSVASGNYYYSIGSFSLGDAVDYYVKAVDDSSASSISDTNSFTVQDTAAGDSVNILNYQLTQYDASKTYAFGDITMYDGDYVIVGRDADQASFEAFWGITIPSNATYINSAGAAISINGAETYSLDDGAGTRIDSTTSPLSGGNTAQRDATNVNTWTQSADINATPGSGVTGGNNAGLVITEYSDASGTGNYIYEFVELYFDASDSGTNSPPIIDSIKTIPAYVEPADNVTGAAFIRDDSGVSADTMFYKVGDSGAWASLSTDSVSGDGYYYTLGSFNENDTVYYYEKAVDDSAASTISSTESFIVQYYAPEITNTAHSPAPVVEGNTVINYADIVDYNGTISLAYTYYWVNGGSTSSISSDSVSGNTYYFTLGSFTAGDTVSYYVFARDNDNNITRSDTMGFTVLAAPDYSVKVNEFASDGPSGGDTPSEWIELYNTGADTVDISGYTLTDGEDQFAIPPSTELAPGEFYLLVQNIDSFNAYFSMPVGTDYYAYGDSAGSFALANSGDEIILKDASSIEVDYANYGTGANPAPTPAEGSSASRNPDGTDTDNCTNDFTELTVPTPGSKIVMGPSIANVSRDKYLPLASEDITVTCTAADGDGISGVYLVASFYDSNTVDTFEMLSAAGDTFAYTIPAKNDGCRTEYFIYAVDNASDTTVTASQGRFFWGYTSIPKLKQIDSLGYPRYYGYAIRSTGIVTTETGTYSSFANIINFQENYILGAVVKTDTIDPHCLLGDSITAEGTIGMWNGQTRIDPPNSAITIHSSGHAIDTIFITADDLMDTTGETYEGLLAQIDCYGIHSGTWPAAGSNGGLWMMNDTVISKGDLCDTFYMWVDVDTDIDGTTEPAWGERIVGIISQYDISEPYFSGYQMLPRDSKDVNTGLNTLISNCYVSLSIENNNIVIKWNIEGVKNLAAIRIERKSESEEHYKVIDILKPDSREYRDSGMEFNRIYTYRIVAVTDDSRKLVLSTVKTSRNMLIDELDMMLSRNTMTDNNAWIELAVPASSSMNISLYDLTGRQVKNIFTGSMPGGRNRLYMNTSDIAAGTYFIRLSSQNKSIIKKINIIK
ncbi:MAG: lamin tail domain-containing protein [bacterium]